MPWICAHVAVEASSPVSVRTKQAKPARDDCLPAMASPSPLQLLWSLNHQHSTFNRDSEWAAWKLRGGLMGRATEAKIVGDQE